MLESTVEVISPSLAAEYLKSNTFRQRPLNRDRVDYYARMMSAGQWIANGEPIVFDVNGSLADGQHRLYGCIKANVPFETLVVRNAPEESFRTFDQGLTRTKSQVFQIAGVRNATGITSIIQYYLRAKSAETSSPEDKVGGASPLPKRMFSSTDMFDEYDQSPDYWQMLWAICKKFYTRCAISTISETGGAIAFLNKCKGYDFDYVVNFFEQMFLEERCELDVIRKLRRKLIDDRMGRRKLQSQARTGLIVKAWECYKSGQNPGVLVWNRDAEKTRFFE